MILAFFLSFSLPACLHTSSSIHASALHKLTMFAFWIYLYRLFYYILPYLYRAASTSLKINFLNRVCPSVLRFSEMTRVFVALTSLEVKQTALLSKKTATQKGGSVNLQASTSKNNCSMAFPCFLEVRRWCSFHQQCLRVWLWHWFCCNFKCSYAQGAQA